MNEILPDDAVSPDKLELIMMRLDEERIEMLDEAEAERMEAKRKKAKTVKAAKLVKKDQPVDLAPAQDLLELPLEACRMRPAQ